MRARRAGERAAARLRARVAAALGGPLGEAVREEGEMVIVEGRRAVARVWADPALRWIAGLLK